MSLNERLSFCKCGQIEQSIIDITDSPQWQASNMSNKKTLLTRENEASSALMVLILLSAISGFGTWWVTETNMWEQWSWLIHTAVGIALSIQFVPYLFVHIQRILSHRRWLLVSSGAAMVIAALILISTGMVLVYAGQTEQTPWLLEFHIPSACSFLALLLCHIVIHVTTRRDPQKLSSATTLVNGKLAFSKHLGFSLMAVVGLVLLLEAVLGNFRQPYATTPIVEDYELPYGVHPFRPSQTETWHNQFVDYRQIAISNECSGCHREIANEWTSSIHRHAASDKAYVTNVSLLAENRGVAATRYCEGCHSPVALLTGQLSAGGDHGGGSRYLGERRRSRLHGLPRH